MPQQLPMSLMAHPMSILDKVTVVAMRKDVLNTFGHLRLGPKFHYVLHMLPRRVLYAPHSILAIKSWNSFFKLFRYFSFISAFLFKCCLSKLCLFNDLSWLEGGKISSGTTLSLKFVGRTDNISKNVRGQFSVRARIKSRASQICYQDGISTGR